MSTAAPEPRLRQVREEYAREVLSGLAVEDPRLFEAFAHIRREEFLGPGPWPLCRGYDRYALTPDGDAAHLYCDLPIGIDPARNLNNGVPSVNAALMSVAGIRPGEHVVHIGVGTGYFTAILAELVGHGGRITAIEYDPEIAARATANLLNRGNVTVLCGNGATTHFDPANVIYVCTGVTYPPASWLDGLKDGGRLILPLSTNESFVASDLGSGDLDEDLRRLASRAAVFLIDRRGDEYDAHWYGPLGFIPAVGIRDERSEAALAASLARGGWEHVRRLHRDGGISADRSWLRGDGWCLAYR